MHFGKIIRRARGTAPVEWSQQWMNYQEFKDILDDVVHELLSVENDTGAPIDMTQLKTDEYFFHRLTLDLNKVEMFFTAMQTDLYNKVKDLVEKKQLFDTHTEEEQLKESNNLLNYCIHINGQLVLLEMYAHVNYCGFSKITKKHDKLTTFNTQFKFMKNKVNNTKFANFKVLRNLIEVVNQIYTQISTTKQMDNTDCSSLEESKRRTLSIPIDSSVKQETQQIEASLKDIDAPEVINA